MFLWSLSLEWSIAARLWGGRYRVSLEWSIAARLRGGRSRVSREWSIAATLRGGKSRVSREWSIAARLRGGRSGVSREWSIAARLRGGRSRIRNLVWARDYSLRLFVYTDEGGPPSLLFSGYRVLSRRPVMLATHHHLAPKLQRVELHYCSPYIPSWRDREIFTFFTC